jgi:hypothetical protein
MMTRLIVLAAAILTIAAPAVAAHKPPAPTASVAIRDGDVVYIGADGAAQTLTSGGGYTGAALSPDGKTAAFIRADGPPIPAGGAGNAPPTSLWVADVPGGAARQVIGSRSSDDMKQIFVSYAGPSFSADGAVVYVTADAWATSGAVHAVNIATGEEHYVIDGGLKGVIRTGRFRGDLLVTRHLYHPAPQYGAYEPTFVVSPDGKQLLMVPDSDKEDDADHVGEWLAKNHWTAS